MGKMAEFGQIFKSCDFQNMYIRSHFRQNGNPAINDEIDSLQNRMENVDMTGYDDKQKERLEEFLINKEKVGELNGEDLEKLGELGAGNGGVVNKVLHKPTSQVMARKVCWLLV